MNAYASHIVSYLVAQSWQIAILAAIVGLIALALRNRSAHIRYLLWLIVLVKCLVPPVLTVPVAVLPERAPSPLRAILDLPQEPPMFESPALAEAASRPHEPARAAPGIRQVVALAWITGTSLFLLWVGGRAIRYASWLRERRRPLSLASQESIRELSLGFKFKKWPRIWLLEDISQPFVWGLLRGSVYLPADIVGVADSGRQRSILAHELSHVARFDAGVNLLQVLAQAVYWFHPLVWWTNRKIRQEREKCCDETAVARLNTPPEHYSGAIVDTLAAEHRSAHPIPSLAIVGSVRDIEERIRTMLKPGKTFRTRPTLVAATVASLVALVTIPTALVLTARGQAQAPAESANKPAASNEKTEQPRYPARTFNSTVAFDVLVEPSEGGWMTVGHTPSATPLAIPACRVWWVQPSPPVEDWDLLVREINQNEIPGLWADSLVDSDLRHLANCVGLRFLDLSATSKGVTDVGIAYLRGLTGLWGLNLYGTSITDAGLSHLKGLMQLRVLNLRDTQITDVGLADVKGLAELQELGLGGTRITDVGLSYLGGLTRLRKLQLWGTQITDTGLGHLKGMTELQELALGGTPITDAGFRQLKGLTGLQHLGLGGTKITDAGLEQLKGFTRLRHLRPPTGTTGAGMEHLKGLSDLRSLSLSEMRITDADLQPLEDLTGLQDLDLYNTPITDAGLAHLRRMTGLRNLTLHSTQVTDVGLEHLKDLIRLERLTLNDTRVTGPGLEHLQGLTRLQHLLLHHTQLTDVGLEHLKGLTGLQELELNFTQVTGEGVTYPSELRCLRLAGTKVTDAGIAGLRRVRGLWELNLTGTLVTDAGMEHLGGLTRLQHLNLSRTQITDAGLADLKALTQLQTLGLGMTRVSDAGVESLKSLTELRTLSLNGTRITDTGLEYLKGLTQLQELLLSRTQVTDAGVEQLRQSLPKLTVTRW